MKEYGKLIYVGIGLVALLLSYFFGFQKFTAENDDLSTEVDALQERCDSLKAEYGNKAAYEKDIEDFNSKYEEILKKFDADISNEEQIMDAYNYQGTYNVKVDALTLSAPTETYAFDGSLTTSEMLAQTTTTAPDGTVIEADPIITSTAINNTYRGISNDMQMTVTGDYANLKAVLNDIITGKKRKVLSGITFTPNATEEVLSCTMSVKEYAITGDDRESKSVEIPDAAVGRSNLFFTGLGTAPTPAPEQ